MHEDPTLVAVATPLPDRAASAAVVLPPLVEASANLAARRPDSRKLIVIVHADMVGYSRLVAFDDVDIMLRLGTLRRELIDPTVREYGGKIVNSAGDSLLMVFDSIDGAVRSAIAVQRRVPEYDGVYLPDRHIRYRMGINIGDVIADGTDLYGDGVNIAARLQARCPPGHICISRAIRDHTIDQHSMHIEELGALVFKNIARPIEAFVLRLHEQSTEPSRPSGELSSGRIAQPDRPSIAVLPFANMSGDPDQEYFSDGIAEDIVTELSRNRSLVVIARNSSFGYRKRNIDVRQIARELGVRYVHEGSVRRVGDRVRVTAQLIDAEAGSHLWAERFDRNIVDIFSVQDEITNSIVNAIKPEIELAEQRRAVRKLPENLDAWEAYQRGLWHKAKLGIVENEMARGFFQRAIEVNPAFSRPHHALAHTYFDDALLYFTRTFPEAAELADAPAHRAVVLDPHDSDAHAVLALVSAAQGDLAAELARADQALLLDPNCALAHRIKGACLVCSPATRAEGCQSLLKSLRLNPGDPRNWWIWSSLAIGRYLLEDYMGAAEAANLAVRIRPAAIGSYRWLIASLGQLDRTQEARDVARQTAAVLSPIPFDKYARRHLPWLAEADHLHMLEGLGKARLNSVSDSD
jgi:adenylate cyclase